ncbi:MULTISPECIES: bifunctional 3-(3-hydroxy-phenyl)propionate/3-hydroxycinnamic acid hydroxylase [unclassified Microbacterium]|uniref:bifunctional 3-(3-hydroxy-phenyl)propionate/3-hydroxycinnamic acid hydroxylase n=1 Tax=unclassified Microbacterium TaxID=2609290 RepID=UPI00301A92BD
MSDSSSPRPIADVDADVVIVGAGPTGLMSANLLGSYGIRTIVLDAGTALIDYPRGVGMDDETLRTFQAAGLVDAVLPHTIPHQLLVFVDRKQRDLARLAPPTAAFGWPRRNGFVQPLADRVLYDGLARFPHVDVRFGETVTGFTSAPDHVALAVSGATGPHTVTARYVLGADGGRSVTRKSQGISFTGSSSSEDWLVIDIDDDPLGRPGAYVCADPRRPYVSISIPHGIRRFEFMLLPDETAADAERTEFVRALLAPHVAAAEVNIIRHRVYTHHSRIAGAFRSGRVLLAGDAAHLMPVWQGQGYNSGIRDAFNVSWKLAMAVTGTADDRILDTYDLERREHAAAMIQLSRWVGNIVSIRSRVVAAARDLFFRSISHIPRMKTYIVTMRFKPMPRMRAGALSSRGATPTSPVGQLFIQPTVVTRDAAGARLDDALGPWFALLAWNNDPARLIDGDARAFLDRIGARLFAVRPAVQLGWDDARGTDPAVEVIGDTDGSLKSWFDAHPESVLLLRPDRIIAGAAPAHAASAMVASFAEAIGARAVASPAPSMSGEER